MNFVTKVSPPWGFGFDNVLIRLATKVSPRQGFGFADVLFRFATKVSPPWGFLFWPCFNSFGYQSVAPLRLFVLAMFSFVWLPKYRPAGAFCFGNVLIYSVTKVSPRWGFGFSKATKLLSMRAFGFLLKYSPTFFVIFSYNFSFCG
jgi:hypothetical protein